METQTGINHHGIKIEIRPLSVNDAWKGQRFKTARYKIFERDVLFLLPKIKLPPPPFEIIYDFGFSNICSDIDNPVKPFQDILQEKYGFNDRNILRIVINKKIVQKGKEYIYFQILHYEEEK